MTLIDFSPSETVAQRAQRLMSEARTAASDQVQLLEEALTTVHRLAAAVAEGGEIYPVGVRDLSRKVSDDAAWCGQTLVAIMRNTGTRKTTPEGLLAAESRDDPEVDAELVDQLRDMPILCVVGSLSARG